METKVVPYFNAEPPIYSKNESACHMSVDTFLRFWQDKELRKKIYQRAWIKSIDISQADDMRSIAWTAVCLLPETATFHMAERAAMNAMQVEWQRYARRNKKRQKTMKK
jgi:hypothetical protein